MFLWRNELTEKSWILSKLKKIVTVQIVAFLKISISIMIKVMKISTIRTRLLILLVNHIKHRKIYKKELQAEK